MAKRTAAQSLWVQGQSLAIPQHATQYEVKCQELGLEGAPIDQLVKSKELKAFCVVIKNTKYAPEVLLKCWGLTVHLAGEWHITSRRGNRISYEDARSVQPDPQSPSI